MFFDDSRPDRRKRAKGGASSVASLERSPIPPPKAYELFDPIALFASGDRTLVFDVESYPNYFEVGFKCVESKRVIYFENGPDGFIINGFSVDYRTWAHTLGFILHRFRVVGFNSKPYDLPMLGHALDGLPAWKLNELSNSLIFSDERNFDLRLAKVNHIDLIEVAPIQASLKIYGGRLHCERMQDLPFAPQTYLTKEQAAIVRDYNINDLDVTEALFEHLKPHIELREELGKEYDQDLRSKSDAQVAEAIITTELRKLTKLDKKPTFEDGQTFFFKKPSFLEFQTPVLKQLLDFLCSVPLVITANGKPKFPQDLAALAKPYPGLQVRVREKDGKRSHVVIVQIGGKPYTVAMGGLHSNEESIAHKADADTLIVDRDVASYYPNIILNQGLYPPHIGPVFLEVYRKLVLRRLEAKRLGHKSISEGLKIAINGIFGKLGNIYSRVFAPDLLAQVTLSGQLFLLMLIEAIELAGIPVVSANTDGVVIRCPKARYEELETLVIAWEEKTGFITEETRYRGLYCRDVNNYIAVKEDGECKTKGVYSERGSAQNSVLSKNPECLIVSDAVQAFLATGKPVADAINESADVRRFVSVRTVKGGAAKDGVYLGKAVRWYYAQGERGELEYVLSGNKVPKSQGAKPLMILPQGLPGDLDKDWYINEANATLYEVGYYKKAELGRLF